MYYLSSLAVAIALLLLATPTSAQKKTKEKDPEPEVTEEIKLKVGEKCWQRGDSKNNQEVRDARCAGALVCAKKGRAGRNFGCEDHYCCSKADDKPAAGDEEPEDKSDGKSAEGVENADDNSGGNSDEKPTDSDNKGNDKKVKEEAQQADDKPAAGDEEPDDKSDGKSAEGVENADDNSGGNSDEKPADSDNKGNDKKVKEEAQQVEDSKGKTSHSDNRIVLMVVCSLLVCFCLAFGCGFYYLNADNNAAGARQPMIPVVDEEMELAGTRA